MPETIRVKKSRLQGKVTLSGAKNSALRLLAASLLTDEDIFIDNFPLGISDAHIHIQMLERLGKVCQTGKDRISILSAGPLKRDLVWEGRSIRNTLLIFGALLARCGRAKVPLPGGCNIGDRKFDLHQMLLEKLGARIWEEGGYLCGEAPNGLQGTDIFLPIRSTGATENSILAGCLAQGTTTVWNPHIRPEILDLVAFLRTMGARIEVRGNESINIRGVEKLNGAKHTVIPDNVEALTFFIGSVITGGDVEIDNFPFEHLEVPLIHLRESGAKFYRGQKSLIVRGGECYPVEISTGPYPGINSDMQPLFAVYGLCARGQSRITDLRFPDRFGYAEEMAKMGLNYTIEKNILKINGTGGKLKGAEVCALDLRTGVALLLCGLVAEGVTTITDAWQIERGYNDFLIKFKNLNAQIFEY
ncbi:MAG: UDP-N-acetylglucosamine 1-carboxyvinyltransferase [Desulfobaccales bacterium]